MSKNIQRLIRIYGRLKRGPVTIEIISNWAKHAGIDVSNRQLYRDLLNLQHLTFAEGENVIEYVDEKNRKTWKLEYDESIDTIKQYDINSFFLFKNFVPSSIQRYREESLEKFEKILYKNFSKNKYKQQINANEMYLRRTNYQDMIYSHVEHKHLEDLMWALQNKRAIQILANEVNASNIDYKNYSFPLKLLPIELLYHDGQVHVAGLEAHSTKLLVYQVNGHLRIVLTNETFNRRKYYKTYLEQLLTRFGISEPIKDKAYNIKIEFSEGYGLSKQQNFLHPSETWRKFKNGNYMLEMTCSLTRELIGFLGFSLDKVKVHQPKALKDLVKKKFKDTLSLYEGKVLDEERSNEDYKKQSKLSQEKYTHHK